MLGFDAFGRTTLGQISGTKTVDLVAAAGSFALTGEPVTFKATEVVANGSFTLTGEAVAFAATMLAAQGAYTLTGLPALHGIDFNKDSVGSSISGGTFSRKRWRDMLDADERRRAAAVRRIADEKLRRRAEQRRRELAEFERRRAAREASKAEGEARMEALALAHHQAAVRGMDRLRAISHAAGTQAAIGRSAPSIDDDDEDVIALIMAMHQ